MGKPLPLLHDGGPNVAGPGTDAFLLPLSEKELRIMTKHSWAAPDHQAQEKGQGGLEIRMGRNGFINIVLDELATTEAELLLINSTSCYCCLVAKLYPTLRPPGV